MGYYPFYLIHQETRRFSWSPGGLKKMVVPHEEKIPLFLGILDTGIPQHFGVVSIGKEDELVIFKSMCSLPLVVCWQLCALSSYVDSYQKTKKISSQQTLPIILSFFKITACFPRFPAFILVVCMLLADMASSSQSLSKNSPFLKLSKDCSCCVHFSSRHGQLFLVSFKSKSISQAFQSLSMLFGCC